MGRFTIGMLTVATVALSMSQAQAANIITFGENSNSCGGAVMCSTDGTHGYLNDGSGQAFNISAVEKWFQIDFDGNSHLQDQPAEPNKGAGAFLVFNDTGKAIHSISLKLYDDFNAGTASVHACTGAQPGQICDNFTAHGGSGSYKFNTRIGGDDWDKCTQGTITKRQHGCTGAAGGVAADFAPDYMTYGWKAQTGGDIPPGAYFTITFSSWNNNALRVILKKKIH